MQLTQKNFEKGISNLLEKLEEKIASKDDLKTQTTELKQYVQESFEVQQEWMDERFKELIVVYDVRERVGKLEKDVKELKLNASSTHN